MTRPMQWLFVSLAACALTGCMGTGGWRPWGFGSSTPSYSGTYGGGPAPSDVSMGPTVTPPSVAATPVSPSGSEGVSFVEQPAPTGWGLVTAPFTSAASAVSSAFAPAPAQKPDPTQLDSPSAKINSQTYVSWAKLHEEKKDLAKADEFYRKAIETDPRDLVARISYGRMYHRQDKLDRAIAIYRDATTQFPNDPVAYNDLALCHARLGQWQPALDALTRAVQLEPANKLYRGNMAMVLVEAGRAEEAFAHLAAVHPADIAHYNQGYLLLTHKRDQAGAAQHFAKALEANPNLVPARQMLAKLQPAAGGDALARREVPAQPQWPANSGTYAPGGVRVSPDTAAAPAQPAQGSYMPPTYAPAPMNPGATGPSFSPAAYQVDPSNQMEGLPPVN